MTIAKADPAVQIERKMPEVEFIYRLGNMDAVSINSLIKNSDDSAIDLSKLSVSVAPQVSGAYDATKGELTFTGTGVVEITFTGDANSVSLTFEIVNATNATSAASATKNNVVLLNDCSLGSITVSNGCTLFGNGFTMSCGTDTPYHQLGNAYVNLTNGTLDNVKIVLPNFPAAYMYQSQMQKSDNDGNGKYYSVYDGVQMQGDSKILNSYISGASSTVAIRSGKALLDNTTIKGGSLANILISSKPDVTLKDVTLIQKPIQANVTDTTKTVMGFSVLVKADGDGTSAPITLEGVLNQFAWANETYTTYVPDGAENVVKNVMDHADYIHNISLDGQQSAGWVNFGIAYFPFEIGKSVNDPTVVDNRTNKATVVYSTATVSGFGTNAKVYTYKNTNTAAGTVVYEPKYEVPETNAVTLPMVTYTETVNGLTGENTYATDGWTFTLTADLDTMGSYTFDFSKLVVSKYGKPLSYTVKDANGNTVGQTVALTDSGVREYTLTITDNADCNGNATHTYVFVLIATKKSIDGPVKVAEPGGDALLVVKAKDSDWTVGIPALEGTQIKYYSKVDKAYKTLNLSSICPTTKGKQNGTDNFWEYADANGDFTFKVTCGYIHDRYKIYGMPVVVDNGGNKMYFTISSTNGYVSTGTASRAVTLSFEFTDSNGQKITFSKTWNCNRSDMISAGAKQYSYSDFCNGTLKEASGGGMPCFTPDTLITMADGTQKEVRYVSAEDMIVVWDFFNGEYTIVPAGYVMNHGYGDYTVVALRFSDGTQVKTITGHGFFDADTNEFAIINAANVESYVGHDFMKQSGNGFETVELVSYEVYQEYTESWSILSYKHYNCFIEGMLSITPHEAEGNFFMPFAVGQNMMFDQAMMAADIAKYGLYTYEEFADVMSEELFEALNMPYVKVAVGKGITSEEDIWFLLNLHFGIERK